MTTRIAGMNIDADKYENRTMLPINNSMHDTMMTTFLVSPKSFFMLKYRIVASFKFFEADIFAMGKSMEIIYHCKKKSVNFFYTMCKKNLHFYNLL